VTPEKLDELEGLYDDDGITHIWTDELRDLIAAARRETALREAIEALPTNHINWHDAEGDYDEHCHVVKVTDVLVLLSEVPQ